MTFNTSLGNLIQAVAKGVRRKPKYRRNEVLLSNLYPISTEADSFYVSSLNIVKCSLKDAPIFEDNINVSLISVVSGSLKLAEIPVQFDSLTVQPISIISGKLKEVILQLPPQTETSLAVSPINVLSGRLKIVVLQPPTQVEQQLIVGPINVISGSLL